MSIEESRAKLVAFVENEYGGQEVLKLADAYVLAALEEAMVYNDALPRVTHSRRVLKVIRHRIEALR